MSGDFLTYVDISDAIKGAYCPRQYFYMSSDFEKTDFFVNYCTHIPCDCDIEGNRKECWKKLCNRGPYVQDENIKTQQQSISMDEFNKKLAEYVRDCGINQQVVNNKIKNRF